MEEDIIQKHKPQNRGTSISKLRRSRKHCPICLTLLEKNLKRTRLKRQCTVCGAQRLDKFQCKKCGRREIWMSPMGTACQSCGNHGSKLEVAIPSAGSTFQK